MSQLSKKIVTILLVVTAIAAMDYKLYSLYTQYEEFQDDVVRKVERIGESIRSGQKICTPESTADLLSAASDRATELYTFNFWVWVSILASNFGVLAFPAGYIFGKRSTRVSNGGKN